MTDKAIPPPPGWYIDPDGSEKSRWWDGIAWTEHFQIAKDGGAGLSVSTDPPAVLPIPLERVADLRSGGALRILTSGEIRTPVPPEGVDRPPPRRLPEMANSTVTRALPSASGSPENTPAPIRSLPQSPPSMWRVRQDAQDVEAKKASMAGTTRPSLQNKHASGSGLTTGWRYVIGGLVIGTIMAAVSGNTQMILGCLLWAGIFYGIFVVGARNKAARLVQEAAYRASVSSAVICPTCQSGLVERILPREKQIIGVSAGHLSVVSVGQVGKTFRCRSCAYVW